MLVSTVGGSASGGAVAVVGGSGRVGVVRVREEVETLRRAVPDADAERVAASAVRRCDGLLLAVDALGGELPAAGSVAREGTVVSTTTVTGV
jgi:hypothetical protein